MKFELTNCTLEFSDAIHSQNLQFDTAAIVETFLARINQSYIKKDVEIVTMPLKKDGYFIDTDGEKFIFVNSKLPRSARSNVIAELMKGH